MPLSIQILRVSHHEKKLVILLFLVMTLGFDRSIITMVITSFVTYYLLTLLNNKLTISASYWYHKQLEIWCDRFKESILTEDVYVAIQKSLDTIPICMPFLEPGEMYRNVANRILQIIGNSHQDLSYCKVHFAYFVSRLDYKRKHASQKEKKSWESLDATIAREIWSYPCFWGCIEQLLVIRPQWQKTLREPKAFALLSTQERFLALERMMITKESHLTDFSHPFSIFLWIAEEANLLQPSITELSSEVREVINKIFSIVEPDIPEEAWQSLCSILIHRKALAWLLAIHEAVPYSDTPVDDAFITYIYEHWKTISMSDKLVLIYVYKIPVPTEHTQSP